MAIKICELIDNVSSRANSFSFVWRDHLSYNANAKKFANSLAPFLVRESRVCEWPGTKLDSISAKIRYYDWNTESVGIIAAHNTAFEFLAPDYPEDLAIYDEGGKLLYSSCSHEMMEDLEKH